MNFTRNVSKRFAIFEKLIIFVIDGEGSATTCAGRRNATARKEEEEEAEGSPHQKHQ